MEINKVYRLYINDYLYIDLAYDGSEVMIASFGNCPFDSVAIVNAGNRFILKVAGIPRASFDSQTGELLSNLYMVPTSVVRNYSENLNAKGNDIDYSINQTVYENNPKRGVALKSELHTHFMEVLSGQEYLDIILKYLDWVGLDANYSLCQSYPTLTSNPRELEYKNIVYQPTREYILKSQNAYENLSMQLSLPTNRQVDFNYLIDTIEKRIALLDLVGYTLASDAINSLDVPENELENAVRKLRSDAKAEVYVELLIKSLEVLKKQGIKYVEFSFSTPSTIKKLYDRLKGRTPEGIKFNFILSEDRNSEPKYFIERYKHGEGTKRNKTAVECVLPKLIQEGYVIGFDLMGMEKEIVKADYQKDSCGNSSLYDKLEPILKKLNLFNNKNLVCRLHAGEIKYNKPTYSGKSNPEKTLEIIDLIAKNNGLTIPPPSIRIGHGLHIIKNENYLNLLKKYRVTVELNATSNFALGNVKNMFDIPYKWYTENGIPVVLGTDGGGMYFTSAKNEASIAETFGGRAAIKSIRSDDNDVIERRGL